MWNNPMFAGTFTGQPMFINSLSESIQYLAQLNGSMSISALRAQAEMVARSIQEVETQLSQLEEPELGSSAQPGWGVLFDQALSTMLPGLNTKAASAHLLKAYTENLRASHSFYLAAIAAIEKSGTAAAPPQPEKVIIT